MSAATVSGVGMVVPIGPESPPALAAGERVRTLQALIARIERPSIGSGSSFATALDAAQTSGVGAATTVPQGSSSVVAPGAIPTSNLQGSSFTASAEAAGQPIDISAATGLTTQGSAGAATPDAMPSSAGVSASGSAYVPLIEQASARYGLDPSVLYGLIEQESGFDPTARSSAGALGLTQLMPATAASLGVSEPLNPAEAISGGARYLSQLLHQFGGNTADALAAYNAGPGAVQRYGGVPPYPETQQYVTKVLGYAAAYGQSKPGEVLA